MPDVTEEVVHVAVRRFLDRKGWQLVAGQYPGGSDDELPALNVMDPVLARDNSPDHRRHSKHKLVPDLLACKGRIMLIIEMKARYSPEDEQKLERLLGERRSDFLSALRDLVTTRGVVLPAPIEELAFVPCLGFAASSSYQANQYYCYFKVGGLSQLTFEGNAMVPAI